VEVIDSGETDIQTGKASRETSKGFAKLLFAYVKQVVSMQSTERIH
jgi:hypothetical protein